MKWARFTHNGTDYQGYLQNGCLLAVEGDVFAGNWQETGESLPLDDITLLAPCQPTKVVAIGLNYRDHAAEMKMELPQEPILFLKPPSSVIGTEMPIIYPAWIGQLDYEAELAIVIGKRTKNVVAADAHKYIFAYTCSNDVTARSLQAIDGQWSRAKAFDTFCPLGPWMETELDTSNLNIVLELNGQLRQHSNTNQLVFDPSYLVAFASRVMTLEPGDVIITGTPGGIGPMNVNDRVVVRIEGIGELINWIKAD
ncbi:MAG: fumarylacetoacetate hydrolase family protein, partial [Firmicutes bacterium]|nr:fumarylacetoacetate hydrolase family protein [Bacillota bacterium]